MTSPPVPIPIKSHQRVLPHSNTEFIPRVRDFESNLPPGASSSSGTLPDLRSAKNNGFEVQSPEIILNEKGEPVSGKLEALIEFLINSILSNRQKTNFLTEFMTVYRCFTTPPELFEILTTRFRSVSPDSKDERLRIASIFKHWLKTQFYDFGEDLQLYQQMESFVKNDASYLIGNTWELAVKQFYEPQRSKAVTTAPPLDLNSTPTKITTTTKTPKIEEIKSILKVKPEIVAEQLSLMEHDKFRKLTPKEIYVYAKEQRMGYPNISNLILLFEKVVQWSTQEITSRSNSTDESSKILIYLLDVVQELRSHNNFDLINALLITLNRNQDKMGANMKKRLIEYNDLIGPNYGEVFHSAPSPKIPRMSRYLQQFKYSVESVKLSSKVQIGSEIHINYKKWRDFSTVIQQIQMAQQGSYLFQHQSLVQQYILSETKIKTLSSCPNSLASPRSSVSSISSGLPSSPPKTSLSNFWFFNNLKSSFNLTSSSSSNSTSSSSSSQENISLPTALLSEEPENDIEVNTSTVTTTSSAPTVPTKSHGSGSSITRHNKNEGSSLHSNSSSVVGGSSSSNSNQISHSISKPKGPPKTYSPKTQSPSSSSSSNTQLSHDTDLVLAQHTELITQYRETINHLAGLISQIKPDQSTTQIRIHDGTRIYVVGEDGATIGRDGSCEIQYPENKLDISRFHARIEYVRGNFRIRSITATHRVYINKQLIPKNQVMSLNINDVVHISTQDKLTVIEA